MTFGGLFAEPEVVSRRSMNRAVSGAEKVPANLDDAIGSIPVACDVSPIVGPACDLAACRAVMEESDRPGAWAGAEAVDLWQREWRLLNGDCEPLKSHDLRTGDVVRCYDWIWTLREITEAWIGIRDHRFPDADHSCTHEIMNDRLKYGPISVERDGAYIYFSGIHQASFARARAARGMTGDRRALQGVTK